MLPPAVIFLQLWTGVATDGWQNNKLHAVTTLANQQEYIDCLVSSMESFNGGQRLLQYVRLGGNVDRSTCLCNYSRKCTRVD
jgi:hypothetical protein